MRSWTKFGRRWEPFLNESERRDARGLKAHLVREAESAYCILEVRWLTRTLEQRKPPRG